MYVYIVYFPKFGIYKNRLTPAESGRSCQVILQEGAPINNVKNEEREREEESGNLVDVNGGGSSLAALLVLNCRCPYWTSISFSIRSHRCLWGRIRNESQEK